ncbi:hypothetical protein ACQ3VH_15970 [Bacillus pretiosus]|uniref:hypothetical protein n=1 Tax=Bacillus pretiosus TaxID=2983392 RepID=UPI002ED80969
MEKVKTMKDTNPAKYLSDAMVEAKKKYGKRLFNMIFNHKKNAWDAIPIVKKGNAGVDAYELRTRGYTSDEVSFTN